MGLSPLFGIAKILVRSRKLKIATVGLRLVYLGYTYISDKIKNKQVSRQVVCFVYKCMVFK